MLKNGVRNYLRASLCIALTAYFAPNAFGDLFVASWTIGTTVYDYDASDFDTSFTEVIKNPYQSTLTATYGNSSATAIHYFHWSGDSAHFDTVINHHIQQLHGDTTTGGDIYIRPAVDTNISFNGSWQFSWPDAALGQANILLLVYDVAADQPVAFDGGSGGNVGLGRPYGDLQVQNSGLLLAGELYQIHYFTRIYHFNPTPPGTHGEGSGEIHFSLTPVPEPATLALFALAFLIPRRRP